MSGCDNLSESGAKKKRKPSGITEKQTHTKIGWQALKSTENA